MKHLLPLFIFLIFISCSGRKLYENKSRSCKLVLRNNSTYLLKYPQFLRIRKMREHGTYSVTGNSLLLRYVVDNSYNNMEVATIGYYTKHPDTVNIYFKNINDSAISVSFTINQNPKIFNVDNSGH